MANLNEIIASTDTNDKESIQKTIVELIDSNALLQLDINQRQKDVDNAEESFLELGQKVNETEANLKEFEAQVKALRDAYLAALDKLGIAEDLVLYNKSLIAENRRQIDSHNDLIKAYDARIQELEALENNGVDNELSHLIIPENKTEEN